MRRLPLIGMLLLPGPAFGHAGDAVGATSLWRAYSLDLHVVLPILLVAGLYTVGLARLWRRAGPGRGIERWRAGCFAGAIAALSFALIWPLDGLGATLLSAHMAQHLLLTVVAAPLLVVAAPLTAALWALPPRGRRAAGALAQRTAVRQGWSVLTLPLLAWTFYATSLWLWHMPRFYQAAARDEFLHTLEHLCFLASALVLWWAALRSARTAALGAAAGVFLLFTTSLQDGLLGALLTFTPRPLYALYAEASSLDPLADQQLAGVLMWIFGGLIYLAAALALTWRILFAPARLAPLAGPRPPDDRVRRTGAARTSGEPRWQQAAAGGGRQQAR